MDPEVQIFDPDCAELFSECDYKGESVTICDKVNSLPEQGWAKPIKSVRVPEQRALKLFNQEALKGQQVVYVKDQTCIE